MRGSLSSLRQWGALDLIDSVQGVRLKEIRKDEVGLLMCSGSMLGSEWTFTRNLRRRRGCCERDAFICLFIAFCYAVCLLLVY